MDITDFVKELNSVINSNDNSNSSAVVENTVSQIEPNTETKSEKSIKILIVSTHVNQSNGYSKVVHNIINQLSVHKWINVVHFGTQKILNGDIGRKYPSNVKVIDGSALEKQKMAGFAFSELPVVIQSEKPDIVFIYNDIAVICGYIEEIRKSIQNRFFKIWAYIDTVYKHQPQPMIDMVKSEVERIFCFSKFWKDQLKSQGVTRPIDVMNHAIDNKIIKSVPRDLARQNLGLPKDVFLFTSFNRNIPRKRLDILIMAFVKLIIRFPMKPIFLLIVGDRGDKGGFQLFDIFSRELKLADANIDMFGNRLLITSSNTAYRDEDINLLYNAGDVGISCAEGEGFGLCTFEQMAVGIPQIIPEINGFLEYCTDKTSLIVKPTLRYYIPQAHTTVTGEASMVNYDDVSKAMERYVFDEDLRKLHGKLGKEKIAEYNWEKSCSILIKRMKALQEEEED
jgi:glycosyltransferase involved in cell wall biosynthesis